MEICVACKKRIWPWQKIGFNSSWHKRCAEVWEKGYDRAYSLIEGEYKKHGFPTPIQLYGRRGSIGELLPKKLWRNQEGCVDKDGEIAEKCCKIMIKNGLDTVFCKMVMDAVIVSMEELSVGFHYK